MNVGSDEVGDTIREVNVFDNGKRVAYQAFEVVYDIPDWYYMHTVRVDSLANRELRYAFGGG